MLRLALKILAFKGSIVLVCLLGLFFSACSSDGDNDEVDRLNSLSYSFHYSNLDSTSYYAKKALSLSDDYPSGRAEALNNIAFSYISEMNYPKAYAVLDSVAEVTDNQVELLIADIQFMRLCQREARNRNFYDYRERALKRLRRVETGLSLLSPHQQRRFIYAKSEFYIVCSTYYYYVGLIRQAKSAIRVISSSGEVRQDPAQYINYLYQIGSGGIIEGKSKSVVYQDEFEILFKCYLLSKQYGYKYWEANSLQSMSEHLLQRDYRDKLIADNAPAIRFMNGDGMPDSLLAGYLAQKAMELFTSYGDVYQTAGAYRTLSLCYWDIDDYASSLSCLKMALRDTAVINQAPDLEASIREQLCLVYSAMNEKNLSDINRNRYLDLQERTRQDRQLEARAAQLERTSMQLNLLIVSILLLIVLIAFLLFILIYIGKKRKRDSDRADNLLQPLEKWRHHNAESMEELEDELEEIKEQLYQKTLHIKTDKRINLDNRAKIFLVNNVIPYIDRIINEVKKIKASGVCDSLNADERYAYMAELADKINEYNEVLTAWIKLQQGQLRLHIESFSLKELFDLLAKSAMSFRMKGIGFSVVPSDLVVKADKTLTMFMLNTLSDNARKFTDRGGQVTVSAASTEDYVEISVTDTGHGLTEEQLSGIFNHKIYGGHGFGLMNCRGIIDKYRKISRIFSVCGLFAESEPGKGSRFFFRLPHGIVRLMLCLFLVSLSLSSSAVQGSLEGKAVSLSKQFLSSDTDNHTKACLYADSAYFSNVHGNYDKTLAYADSAIHHINRQVIRSYKTFPEMLLYDGKEETPAELAWFREKAKIDYSLILYIRNEIAVAAMALHRWKLYRYNNQIYTQLFKERSADNGLAAYCLTMQHSRANKTIAVVILFVLLVVLVAAYYFLYYRHVITFRLCVEKIKALNKMLLSDATDEEKLSVISQTDTGQFPGTLKSVVDNITGALETAVDTRRQRELDIELATDELRRATYEEEKIYVSNSVIDNCLSALKHETMYYPSRIRQLVDAPERDILAIEEVVAYYKELYSLLCEQIVRQVQSVVFECKPYSLSRFGSSESVLGDAVLIDYLFETLNKQFSGSVSTMKIRAKDNGYIEFDILCRGLKVDAANPDSLFMPSVGNISYLVCRQIVREISELSGRHGCGIVVVAGCNDNVEPSSDFSEVERQATPILRILLPSGRSSRGFASHLDYGGGQKLI